MLNVLVIHWFKIRKLLTWFCSDYLVNSWILYFKYLIKLNYKAKLLCYTKLTVICKIIYNFTFIHIYIHTYILCIYTWIYIYTFKTHYVEYPYQIFFPLFERDLKIPLFWELEQVYSIACVNWLLSCPEYIFHNTTWFPLWVEELFMMNSRDHGTWWRSQTCWEKYGP